MIRMMYTIFPLIKVVIPLVGLFCLIEQVNLCREYLKSYFFYKGVNNEGFGEKFVSNVMIIIYISIFFN